MPANESVNERAARKQAIRDALRLHSTRLQTLWIEEPNGELLLPFNHRLTEHEGVAQTIRNVGGQAGIKQILRVNGIDYIAHFNRIVPSGQTIWSRAEVTRTHQVQSAFLNWMIVVWGSCLVLSLWVVNGLVRRIIRPLRQLSEDSDQLTADTLSRAELKIEGAPLEVTQLANTYNDLQTRLAKSWSDQRSFVSAVSHELRTPLTIVQGYLHRTLKRSDNLTDSQRKGLSTAEKECVRMNHLLNDLLDLSRSDSGQLRLNHEAVEMTVAVGEAVDLARSSFDRKVLLKMPAELPASGRLLAMADPDRLRQVLLDLIENAHKYSPAKSPVTVRLSQAKTIIMVDVEDQGIGIPEEDLPKVFNRFHRGANASVSSGSGLGLSIVKLLVEAMGGTVDVSSQLGHGSTFTVRLPLSHDGLDSQALDESK
jgi:signal transduction histidine kinase